VKDEDKTKAELINKLKILRKEREKFLSKDITEHKQVEEKYRSFTNDILDASAIGIFILDSDFKVVWINHAIESYFGLQGEKIIGRDKKQLIKKNIQHIFEDPDEFIRKVFSTYDDNTYVENFECHVLPDGRRNERWLEHWSQPIKSGLYVGGRIEHYYDITDRKRKEEALNKSQQEFISLFKNIPEALVYTDKKSNILYVNSKFTKLFGYTLDEIKGKNIDEGMIHTKEKIDEGKYYTKKSLNHFVSYETYRKRKDGSIFPVFISASPIKVNNKVKGIITLYQDITERKQNEKLQEVLYNISKSANSPISLNQLYKTIHKELGNIIDTTNFHISLLDEKENKIYFSYYFDEKDDISSVQKFDFLDTLSAYTIRTKRPLLVNRKQINKMVEERKIKLSQLGTLTKEVIWLGVPLKVRDKVIGCMAVLCYYEPKHYSKKDIQIMEFVSNQVATAIKRKRTEEVLSKSQQEFISLFKSSPEALIYVDEKSNILDINSQFTKLFGYTLEKIKGRNINDGMIHPQDKIKETEYLYQKSLLSSYYNYESIRKKKNGFLFPVSISGSPVVIEGKLKGRIVSYRDITQDKQNEKLQQVLYNISKAANSPISLGQLYKTIHQELGNIIDTTNFLIALIDYQKDEVYFPYFVDEKDKDFPIINFSETNSLTVYVIKTDRWNYH